MWYDILNMLNSHHANKTSYLSKLHWIFPGTPLKVNGAPEIPRVTWQLWNVHVLKLLYEDGSTVEQVHGLIRASTWCTYFLHMRCKYVAATDIYWLSYYGRINEWEKLGGTFCEQGRVWTRIELSELPIKVRLNWSLMVLWHSINSVCSNFRRKRWVTPTIWYFVPYIMWNCPLY